MDGDACEGAATVYAEGPVEAIGMGAGGAALSEDERSPGSGGIGRAGAEMTVDRDGCVGGAGLEVERLGAGGGMVAVVDRHIAGQRENALRGVAKEVGHVRADRAGVVDDEFVGDGVVARAEDVVEESNVARAGGAAEPDGRLGKRVPTRVKVESARRNGLGDRDGSWVGGAFEDSSVAVGVGPAGGRRPVGVAAPVRRSLLPSGGRASAGSGPIKRSASKRLEASGEQTEQKSGAATEGARRVHGGTVVT